MATPKPVPPPYTLDRAVDDEKEFWRHIGDLIDQSIERALLRHKLKEAVERMGFVADNQRIIAERINYVSKQIAGNAANYDQLVSWCTMRQVEDDLLRKEVRQLLDAVTPILPPKTPPEA